MLGALPSPPAAVFQTARPAAATIALRTAPGGRVIARLDPAARELLPRATAVFDLAYRGGVRGDVTAVVALGDRAKTLRRSFRVRL